MLTEAEKNLNEYIATEIMGWMKITVHDDGTPHLNDAYFWDIPGMQGRLEFTMGEDEMPDFITDWWWTGKLIKRMQELGFSLNLYYDNTGCRVIFTLYAENNEEAKVRGTAFNANPCLAVAVAAQLTFLSKIEV